MDLPRYSPMLATRWPNAFSDPEWVFEVKWDGVRALVHWDGDSLEAYSRRGRAIVATYPELRQLGDVPPCILDGEVVALDGSGRPSFGLLQQRMNVATAGEAQTSTPVSFMVFDLLHLDEPLVERPWSERRTELELLELASPYVVAEPVRGDGDALWQAITEQRLEGMVAKRLESTYRPGARSPDWRKVARVDQVRAVVGG